MMNGVIVVNQKNDHCEHKVQRLLKEAKNLDIDLKIKVNDGTIAKIENGNIVISFDCDFVIYLDKDIYLARLLEKNGYILFNNADFIKMCDDKTLSNIFFANHNIKMPKTISSPLVYTNELSKENYVFLEYLESELSYPFIAKKVYGSLGEGVYLVNNYSELKSFYDKYFKEPLQFQEYIKNSFGKSIRVIVIDNEIFGAFERINNTDFRSNFGVNASAKEYQLNKKDVEFVNQIISCVDIRYAGIDLLLSENGPLLCEINSNAFFDVFEKFI